MRDELLKRKLIEDITLFKAGGNQSSNRSWRRAGHQ